MIDLQEKWHGATGTNTVSKNVYTNSAVCMAIFTCTTSSTKGLWGRASESNNGIAPVKADRHVVMTFEESITVCIRSFLAHWVGHIQSWYSMTRVVCSISYYSSFDCSFLSCTLPSDSQAFIVASRTFPSHHVLKVGESTASLDAIFKAPASRP